MFVEDVVSGVRFAAAPWDSYLGGLSVHQFEATIVEVNCTHHGIQCGQALNRGHGVWALVACWMLWCPDRRKLRRAMALLWMWHIDLT